MNTLAVASSIALTGSLLTAATWRDSGVPPIAGERAGQAERRIAARPDRSARIGGGCGGGQEAAWFAPNPRDIQCAANPSGSNNLGYLQCEVNAACDINGDGVGDFHELSPSNRDIIVSGVQQTCEGYVLLDRVDSDASGITSRGFTLNVRVYGPELAAWVYQQYPAVADATVYLRNNTGTKEICGWRDMDGDGDRDFCVFVSIRLTNDGYWRQRQVWFENVGYEKPVPPRAADIYRDGRVDGADLGLVLVSWGPNP